MEYLDSKWMCFCESEINSARERVLEHKQAETRFKNSRYEKIIGQHIIEDFPNCRVNNGIIKDTTFDNIKLASVSFNGALFNNTIFGDCKLLNCNMQSSSLQSSSFNNCILSGSNLSQSYIWDTQFNNSQILGTTLLQSVITNSYFNNCEIKSVSFENCLISETYFANIRLADLNMEYAQFSNIHSENAIYPFAQIPYIFNGLQYILNTKDDVWITSRKNGKDKISVDEYRDILNDLKILYWDRRDYFPLANIYDCEGRKENAIRALNSGVEKSLTSRNFRMLKYYCKLATNLKVAEPLNARNLYKYIENFIQSHPMQENEYFAYYLYQPDIKRILLESFSEHSLNTITLVTNIASEDYYRISILLEVFDTLYNLLTTQPLNKKIELRHNSDYIIEFAHMLPTHYPLIFLGFVCVIVGTSNITNIIEKIQSIIYTKHKETREKDKHRNEILKDQNFIKIQDIELQNKEMQMKQSEERYQHELQLVEQEVNKLLLENEKLLLENKAKLTNNSIFVSSVSATGDARLNDLLNWISGN